LRKFVSGGKKKKSPKGGGKKTEGKKHGFQLPEKSPGWKESRKSTINIKNLFNIKARAKLITGEVPYQGFVLGWGGEEKREGATGEKLLNK